MEVSWSHLYVEFRDEKFSGFRYIEAGWPPQHATKKAAARNVLPKLATSKRISLGSTLGQLRTAYGELNLIGTDRWQTEDGLVFYDSARLDPVPASSRIIEIKFGTCGDF